MGTIKHLHNDCYMVAQFYHQYRIFLAFQVLLIKKAYGIIKEEKRIMMLMH